MSRAKLIVIEGGDNVGKATQTPLLCARLEKEGKKVGTLDFPRYTQNTFGKLVKESLLGLHGNFVLLDPKIASVLTAADRFETKAVLLELLEENDVVILDRYASANMLHQGSKILDLEERAEFIAWLEHVEYDIFAIPKPDLTIALSVSAEHSEAILNLMVEEGLKTADFAEKDREHQKQVATCLTWLSTIKDNWSTIQCSEGDSLRAREDIHEEIFSIVRPLL